MRPFWVVELTCFGLFLSSYAAWLAYVVGDCQDCDGEVVWGWVTLVLLLPFICIEALQLRPLARQILGSQGSFASQLGDYLAYTAVVASIVWSWLSPMPLHSAMHATWINKAIIIG